MQHQQPLKRLLALDLKPGHGVCITDSRSILVPLLDAELLPMQRISESGNSAAWLAAIRTPSGLG